MDFRGFRIVMRRWLNPVLGCHSSCHGVKPKMAHSSEVSQDAEHAGPTGKGHMQRGGHQDTRRKIIPPIRNGLRLVGWNLILTLAGLALLAIAGEVYLRLTTPIGRHFPTHFVPNVGVLAKPHAEVRWSNDHDFGTVQRTNALGFLDRELISPERAAASCHVAMIGDSFVEAREVAIDDKFHVRLEAFAARELPHLDVTTSAFGRGSTGQINQLPFFDEYARHLHPKLLVLVAVANDFRDNSVILMPDRGFNPEQIPYVTAVRDEDGKIRLRPPNPDYTTFRLVRDFGLSDSAVRSLREAWEKVRGTSYFADWLGVKARRVLHSKAAVRLPWFHDVQAELLSWRPRYAPVLDERRSSPVSTTSIVARVLGDSTLTKEDWSLVFRDALDMTGFALDQFKARADRDGVALIILATHTMRTTGNGRYDWLNALAAARGIPVVDQYDYIVGRGNAVEDAHWTHDIHWNPTGHRCAAEALLDYLKQHPTVCVPDRPKVNQRIAAADERVP